MKKLAGKDLSDRLLYVASRTSSAGKAPNPRGRTFNRFILTKNSSQSMKQKEVKEVRPTHPTLRTLSLVREEREAGNSSNWLLKTFRISKFERFAMEDGRAVGADCKQRRVWWRTYI